MFNKEKSEESERGDLYQPVPLRYVIGYGPIILVVLIILVIFLAFAIKWGLVNLVYQGNSTGRSIDISQILLFSLGLIGASFTFVIALWRGEQIYEQIARAQEQTKGAQEQTKYAQEQSHLAQRQIEQTRLQSAIELATQEENAARCLSGLRTLKGIYESLSDTEKESADLTALHVLSLPKTLAPHSERVSRSARQQALDILVNGKFFSQENIQKSLRERVNFFEMSIRYSMMEKNLSRLIFVRRGVIGLPMRKEIIDLSGFSFRRSDFSESVVSKINLSDVDFENADFTNTKMFSVNLSRAKLIDIFGLLTSNLEWAYCTEQPQIRIREWEKWILDIPKITKNFEIPIKKENQTLMQFTGNNQDVSVNVQDFMIRLSLDLNNAMIDESKSSERIAISAPASNLESWKNFISQHKIFYLLKEYEFRKFMSSEVWDYLQFITEKIAENREANQLEIVMDFAMVKTWEEWKEFVKNTESKPEHAEDEVWDYMKRLAKENAKYPPGEDHPEASKI